MKKLIIVYTTVLLISIGMMCFDAPSLKFGLQCFLFLFCSAFILFIGISMNSHIDYLKQEKERDLKRRGSLF